MIELVDIKEIEKINFEGEVYNLELEGSKDDKGDDLFWANDDNIISHNCFPKDTNAIKFLANENGLKTILLDSVLEKNDSIRVNKDWEEQEGRAVINE